MKTAFERDMEAVRERILAEQREREMQNLKRPRCETCDVPLAGSRSHAPVGARICAKCEGAK